MVPVFLVAWLIGAPVAVGDGPAARDWWSLRPLRRPVLPALRDDRILNPIDAFVLYRLREKELDLSPPADRRTLIRRLSFDLTGLPPAPEEVEAFLRDTSPTAYEELVDRLLGSPRYGERWGRHWLDVVHYADTHGYDKDKRRNHAWPYRDYVIRAFNEDRPYARFVQEQLAGDVLFSGTRDGIVATGFIAAGPWDFVGHAELREGTVDKKKARLLDRDDMVMTTFSTFQSLTVHCARCHSHKFDPVPQRDYYRLQAVFAGVDRADRPYDPDPRTARRRVALERQRVALERERVDLESVMEAASSPELREVEARLDDVDAEIVDLGRRLELRRDAGDTLGFHSQIMDRPGVTKWVQVDLGHVRPLDALLLVPSHVVYGGHPGPGFGFPPRFRVEISRDESFSRPVVVSDRTADDVPNPGDAPYLIPLGGREARLVRVTATRLWKRTDDWIFALAELMAFEGGRNVAEGSTVTSLDSIEAGSSWGRKYLTDGKPRRGDVGATARVAWDNLSERQGELAAARAALASRREALRTSLVDPEVLAGLDRTALRLEAIAREIASLPPRGLVYAAASEFEPRGNFRPAGAPRPIHLLERGSVERPVELVTPGALSCLEDLAGHFEIPSSGEEGDRRAALARWITDRGNPLTWRSMVNRVWHHQMGRGLVDTPNDFGRMGSRPSHPGLLDWLACEFRDTGGSVKRLQRLIVTSSTYRQSSALRADGEALDADNRLLWRANRRLLAAEEIRDAVLRVSGQLDFTMGGPGYEAFEFEDDHSPRYDYIAGNVDTQDLSRRAVYRFIVRSVGDPYLEALDCADPDISTPVRTKTLTALQALVLLNDPFMVRQAGHLAARLRRSAAALAEQVELGWRLACSRAPSRSELARLLEYARRHGLENACRLLLNLNEFVSID